MALFPSFSLRSSQELLSQTVIFTQLSQEIQANRVFLLSFLHKDASIPSISREIRNLKVNQENLQRENRKLREKIKKMHEK